MVNLLPNRLWLAGALAEQQQRVRLLPVEAPEVISTKNQCISSLLEKSWSSMLY